MLIIKLGNLSSSRSLLFEHFIRALFLIRNAFRQSVNIISQNNNTIVTLRTKFRFVCGFARDASFANVLRDYEKAT